ncbi:MAG: hypothetical protein LBD07_03615 [Spirochaetaceae bacterium]|jgi:hypothetical protein|nr:hypothetical protein [Spirochaetaceae bacterium]
MGLNPSGNKKDAYFQFISTVDFILEMTSKVYDTLDLIFAEWYGKEAVGDAKEKQKLKDSLNWIACVLDNGILQTAYTILAFGAASHDAKISMDFFGNMTLSSEAIKLVFSQNATEVASVTPALQQSVHTAEGVSHAIQGGIDLLSIANKAFVIAKMYKSDGE